MKKAVGVLMIVLFFVGMFAFTANSLTLVVAAEIWAMALGITAFLVVAVNLATSD